MIRRREEIKRKANLSRRRRSVVVAIHSRRLLFVVAVRRCRSLQIRFLISLEHKSKLRRVRATRRKNLPFARLQIIGNRAITSECHLFRRSSNRPKFEDSHIRRSLWPLNLNGAVHAWDFGRRIGLRIRFFGFGGGFLGGFQPR